MVKIFETPTVPRLQAVLDEVRDGSILIPDFQRPLEWDDQRRLMLLDSVAKEMPIGAFLVWRTRNHKLGTLDTLAAFRLPDQPQDQLPRTYMLDGHQRLATLMIALSWTDDTTSLLEQGVRWPMYYDLSADPSSMAFTFYSGRGDPPPTLLPLYLLLDAKGLFEFQKRLYGEGMDAQAEEAEKLANKFKDYQIPIVPLVSEDLDVVTDSFVRINSQGRAMAETHMVRALAYSQYPLEERLEALKARLTPLGWGELDDQVLLNALKVRYGLDVYKAGPRELYKKLEETGFEHALDALEEAVRWAVKRLNAMGVRGPKSLPYAYQLVALAEIKRRKGEQKLPDTWRRRLERWFWVTTYCGYFTGMSNNRIRTAIDHAWEVAQDRAEVIRSDMKREVKDVKLFNFGATRTKAMVLLAVSKIDDPELRESTQDHLGALGAAAVAKLLPDAPSDAPENRVAILPEELERLRETLRQGWGDDASGLQQRYLLPPESAPVRAPTSAAALEILKARRAALRELEGSHIEAIGLETTRAWGRSAPRSRSIPGPIRGPLDGEL